jgi:hypothetical protein
MDVTNAIETLARAGAVFSAPAGTSDQLSLGRVAELLDCSVKWVRTHLKEFPGAWRMPGGELRIPRADVEDLVRRNQLVRDHVRRGA